MAKLIVTLPGAAPLTYPLSEGATNVGRHRDNPIRIQDESVPSHHATLVRSGVNVLLNSDIVCRSTAKRASAKRYILLNAVILRACRERCWWWSWKGAR